MNSRDEQIIPVYSRADLVLLARVYLTHTGWSTSALGIKAASNDRLFWRLFDGLDCLASTTEAASKFFYENWPAELVWPLSPARGRKPPGALDRSPPATRRRLLSGRTMGGSSAASL